MATRLAASLSERGCPRSLRLAAKQECVSFHFMREPFVKRILAAKRRLDVNLLQMCYLWKIACANNSFHQVLIVK